MTITIFSRFILFFTLFVFICFNFCVAGNQVVSEFLDKTPQKDKEELEQLFQDLFNHDNFGYTLFGDKPVSWATYSTTVFDDQGFPSGRGIDSWNKWNVWKKYAHSFPLKHYILIEMPQARIGFKEVYFINKCCFIHKVNEHINLFQETFGEDITGAVLLEKIEKNHKLLCFLSSQQTLIGILLGYGEHNAQLFDKRSQIGHFVYRREFPRIPIKMRKPAKGFSSLREEFNSYFSLLTPFGDSGYSPLLVQSVFFVADHKHPETIALQKKYRKMRGEISAIYAKGNFLEITLSKLTEE